MWLVFFPTQNQARVLVSFYSSHFLKIHRNDHRSWANEKISLENVHPPVGVGVVKHQEKTRCPGDSNDFLVSTTFWSDLIGNKYDWSTGVGGLSLGALTTKVPRSNVQSKQAEMTSMTSTGASRTKWNHRATKHTLFGRRLYKRKGSSSKFCRHRFYAYREPYPKNPCHVRYIYLHWP